MAKAKVFVTRGLPESTIERLAPHCELDVWPDFMPPDYATLTEKTRQRDGLLSLLTDRVDAQLMDAAPKLRVISNLAVGYDNIDVDAATQRQIPVGHTPGVLTETTADFAFALLMAVARRIPEAQSYIRAGNWRTWHPTVLSGQDIYGATLGIVGFGRIGQAVAKRAMGFNMRILVNTEDNKDKIPSFGAQDATFEDILRESDFLSLHVPLTEATQHMISERELAQMKSTAILINTARGGVVDGKALYQALKSSQILAAGLDVTDPEPIPLDDPLLSLDNCLVVPHIASASVATRSKMADIAADNLIAGITGARLPNCVNPQVYA